MLNHSPPPPCVLLRGAEVHAMRVNCNGVWNCNRTDLFEILCNKDNVYTCMYLCIYVSTYSTLPAIRTPELETLALKLARGQ
jgi:hypothetical protein